MIEVYLIVGRRVLWQVSAKDSENGGKMNRRNVLGNQMESSKTVWIVLIGLLVTVLQFIIYYITEENWMGTALAALCFLLGGVGVHLITEELDELFAYLLLPCVCSGSIGLLIPVLRGSILPQSTTVLLGCLLAWLMPVAYACICTWAEGNTILPQFSSFYKKASVLFYLVYFGVLVYWFVAYHRIPEDSVTAQFIPFATFAAYVDGVISGAVPVERLVQFLAERILLFLPFGFFVAMAGRKLHGVLRLGLIVVFPIAVELLQYLLGFNSFDADDVVFLFLGGLIGMLGFVIFNAVFQKTTGKNFDGSEIERDYYGQRI